MIRIAVVDDEFTFACETKKKVSDFLKSKSIEHMIYSYYDSELFLSEHLNSPFDLIYLDIDMPKINGIELASRIRKKQSDICIIFLSSYSHFVYETFKYAPYRFIRKEKIEDELLESIQSYCDEVYNGKRYIEFRLMNKAHSIECTENILYVYSLRHDLYIVLNSGESKRLANRIYTMDSLEKALSSYGFIRIHKSYLVNYRYIFQVLENNIVLTPSDDGKMERLPISARRVSEIRTKFHKLTRGEDVL